MGVTYAELDAYLSGEEIAPEKLEIIERLHQNSAHKRKEILRISNG